MSTDPHASDTFAPQSPPPSKGGSKVWIFLGLGCGVVLLLCCGGLVGFSIYFTKNGLQIVQDPVEVQQQGNQVAEFDLPAGVKGEGAVVVKNPVSGQPFMTMVIYMDADKESSIFLTEFGQWMVNADPDELRTRMEDQMRQQGRQMKKLTVAESHDVDVQINGQPATFKIQKAEDPQTKQQFVQVEGVFRGKGGTAVLIGQLKADSFTEDDAEKLVRSIK